MPRAGFDRPNEQVQAAQVVSPDQGLFVGSPEQDAIWDELLHGSRNMMIQAVAGSGKTSTLVQYCLREKRPVTMAFLAFNKHIADELRSRLAGKPNVQAMTYHQLGLKACARGLGRSPRIEKWKVYEILDSMTLAVGSRQEEKIAKSRIAQLVGLAKQYGFWERRDLDWVVDRHDMDLNGMEELVMEAVPKVMKKCLARTKDLDFDDMIWMPRELGFKPQPVDIALTDETQDLNVIQQWLTLNSGDRIVCVGDKNQSIYSFRGADSDSMVKLRTALGATSRGCVDLPLTLTRRCPKSHVRLAQVITPGIRALDDAPEGVVRLVPDVDMAVAEMLPGDMVLCRVNAPILSVAYKLLQRGVKAVVRGRDIGEGIVKLVEQAEDGKELRVAELIRLAGDITDDLVVRFLAMPNERGVMRAEATKDRYGCLVSMTQGLGKDDTSTKVKGLIRALFADFTEDGKPNEAVVLSSVHRGKGLEAGRVWVLRPELMPHPMAKKEHDKAQERNIAYIAVTRAKFWRSAEVNGMELDRGMPGELIFVGTPSGLFYGGV